MAIDSSNGNDDIRWQKHTKPSMKHWSNENAKPLNSCRGNKKYVLFLLCELVVCIRGGLNFCSD